MLNKSECWRKDYLDSIFKKNKLEEMLKGGNVKDENTRHGYKGIESDGI